MANFSPKNPSNIPINIEYNSPTLKNNPSSIWASYSNVVMDGEITKLEHEVFEAIYLMIQETWDKVYSENYKVRENLYAKWLFENNSHLINDFFNSELDLNNFYVKFKNRLLDKYSHSSFPSSSSSSSSTSLSSISSIDFENIVKSAVNAINNVRLKIVEHANNCILEIQNEISSFNLSSSSSSLLSRDARRQNNVLSGELFVDEVENEAIVKSAETEIESIQTLFNESENSPEVKEYLKRVLSYQKKNLNFKSHYVFTSFSQIENVRRIDENFSGFDETIAKTKLFIEKIKSVSSLSVRSLVVRHYKKKYPLDPDEVQKKTNKIFKLFPAPLKLLSQLNFGKIFTYFSAPFVAYTILINRTAIKAYEKLRGIAFKIIGNAFDKIHGLVTRLDNWFFNYISNPLNAFKLGLIIPVFSRFLNWFFNKGQTKKIVSALWVITKAIVLKVYDKITEKIKSIWEAWTEKWPFLKYVEKFVKDVKESIMGRYLLSVPNKLYDFLFGKKTGEKDENGKEIRRGGYLDRLSFDKQIKYGEWKINKEEELEKRYKTDSEEDRERKIKEYFEKNKELSWSTYILNPKYMATTVINDAIKIFNESWAGKFIFKMINFVSDLTKGSIKVLIPIFNMVYEIAKSVMQSPDLMLFINVVKDLFSSPLGILAQTVTMSGLGWPWSLLALPAFLLGDIIYRSFLSRDDKNRTLTIRESYMSLYDMKPDEMFTRSKSGYESMAKALKLDKKQSEDFLNNFTQLYSNVNFEVKEIDSLIEKATKYRNEIKKFNEEGVKTGNLSFSSIPSFVKDVLNFPFLNTVLGNLDDINKFDNIDKQYEFLNEKLQLRKDVITYFLNGLNFNIFNKEQIDWLSNMKNRRELGQLILKNGFTAAIQNIGFEKLNTDKRKSAFLGYNYEKPVTFTPKSYVRIGSGQSISLIYDDDASLEELRRSKYGKKYFNDEGKLRSEYKVENHQVVPSYFTPSMIKSTFGSNGLVQSMSSFNSEYLKKNLSDAGVSDLEFKTFLQKLSNELSFFTLENEGIDNLISRLMNETFGKDFDSSQGAGKALLEVILGKANNLTKKISNNNIGSQLFISEEKYKDLVLKINQLRSLYSKPEEGSDKIKTKSIATSQSKNGN